MPAECIIINSQLASSMNNTCTDACMISPCFTVQLGSVIADTSAEDSKLNRTRAVESFIFASLASYTYTSYIMQVQYHSMLCLQTIVQPRPLGNNFNQ